MEKVTLSVKEFAAMAGVGHNRVREWCAMPDFPASKEGNRYRIHGDAAREWLRRRAEQKAGFENVRDAQRII